MAAMIGRQALEEYGYEEIIRRAVKVHFLRYPDPAKPHADNLVGQTMADAAREAWPVFTRWAVMAGITSQMDSPAPGPADVVAVGELVVGLVHAGAIAVMVLTMSSANAASTTTVAPTTTVTAPPVAATRRRPGQTCDDARLRELEKQKSAACSIKWSCSDDHEKIGTKYEKLLTCPELLARIPIGKACLDARKLVQSECFAGSPEPGHEEIMERLTRGLSQCMKKAATRGPGGGPC
jgi:hypothetical protein